MWGGGYNVSREVLLAIRQGNQSRVEHLVAGLVSALRDQAASARPNPGEGGAQLCIGASMWDFTCAVQRLSRMNLGEQHDPFWSEASDLFESHVQSLEPREIALICNAFAHGAPDRLAGRLGEALLRRAVTLADQLSALDLTMVAHGLAKGVQVGETQPGSRPAPVNRGGGSSVQMDQEAVGQLAAAALNLQFEEDKPQQAALLLSSFVRLRHTRDPALFGRLFGFARKTLPAWDSHALSLFCNAFATASRRARERTTAAGWSDVVGRCTEVLQQANPTQMSCMAHALNSVDAPAAVVTEFYDTLEELLCKRPRVCDFLSAQDVAMLAHGFARHRRPRRVREGDEENYLLPGTSWPFEEHASRRVGELTAQGLAFVLHSVRLRRGGAPLFALLAARLRRERALLAAPGLALCCSAAGEAVSAVGLARPLALLQGLQGDCQRLAPYFSPWQVMYVLEALASVATARSKARGSLPVLWRDHGEQERFLERVTRRASAVLPDGDRLARVQELCSQIREAECFHQTSATDATAPTDAPPESPGQPASPGN